MVNLYKTMYTSERIKGILVLTVYMLHNYKPKYSYMPSALETVPVEIQ